MPSAICEMRNVLLCKDDLWRSYKLDNEYFEARIYAVCLCGQYGNLNIQKITDYAEGKRHGKEYKSKIKTIIFDADPA